MLRFFALSSVHLRQRAELPVSSGEDDGGFYGRGGNSEKKEGANRWSLFTERLPSLFFCYRRLMLYLYV